MATFGDTTQDTVSYQGTIADRYYGSVFTTPADMGTVTELVANIGSGAANDTCKLTIHLHSDLSLVYASDAISTEGAAAARSTGAISVALEPNTAYILGAVFKTASDRFYKHNGAENQSHIEDNSHTTPTGLTSPTHGTIQFQVYATYTPAASGDTADLSFGSTAGVLDSGLSGTFGSVSAPANAGFVRSGSAASAGSVSMVATAGVSPRASAISVALASFAANMGVAPSGLAHAGSGLTLSGIPGLSLGGLVTATADLSIQAIGGDGFSELDAGPGGDNVEFAAKTTVSFSGLVSSNGLVAFGARSVLQQIAAALTSSELLVSNITGVSFAGATVTVTVTVTTPADRIYVIKAEIREYDVLEESRVFRVPAESRVYLVV